MTAAETAKSKRAKKNLDIHPFEKSELGVAPFRFVRVYKSTWQAAPGEPIVAGSSCDHCGRPIMWCCVIHDSTGREFKVGNRCVEKTAAKALTDEIQKAVKRAMAVEQAQKRREKEEAERIATAARIARAQALFAMPAVVEHFKEKTHPSAHYTSQGLTYADYIAWTFQCGMYGGRKRLAEQIIQEVEAHNLVVEPDAVTAESASLTV